MNIHEYQAKALLAKFAVPLLKGGVAYTRDEAVDVARKLGGAVTVVKAQIHAGGRGKGRFKDDPDGKGGVRVSKSLEEVAANAQAMLGHELVTKQTGPAGKAVKRLYIEEGCDIKRELYLSLLVDRAVGRISVIASTEGGMDIETVAHDTPEKIVKQAIDPASGRLCAAGWQKTGGAEPRFIGTEPTGRFLYAANQNSDDIVVFAIDPDKGDRKSTRLNSSHVALSRMPSSA